MEKARSEGREVESECSETCDVIFCVGDSEDLIADFHGGVRTDFHRIRADVDGAFKFKVRDLSYSDFGAGSWGDTFTLWFRRTPGLIDKGIGHGACF